ncbi:MAG: DUF4974 domain-containing protein [Prevotella sp.]|nr:DUF4974 domain-containing protein [Prevotella sp.]
MKQVNNDLREALRMSEPETPQLSADFADRLAERLQEDGTTSDVSPNHLNSSYSPHRWYRRVAAIFIGVLIIGGIAIAAWLASPKPTVSTSSQPERLEASLPPSEEMKARAFDNTPLADIMAVVAKHYGHHVAFADDSLRQLRITTVWNDQEPLATFLESMNELDGLHFLVKGDTIYVEPKHEEGAE